METIIKMWDAWRKHHWMVRFLCYVAVAFFLISALSGCATSVSYKSGDCSAKMNGLFLAHGLSIPVVNECKEITN